LLLSGDKRSPPPLYFYKTLTRAGKTNKTKKLNIIFTKAIKAISHSFKPGKNTLLKSSFNPVFLPVFSSLPAGQRLV